MSINAITPVNSSANTVKSSQADKKSIKETLSDNKKLIIASLGALAVAGIAAAAIIKSRKVPAEFDIEKFKQSSGTFEKGMAKIKGKPYSGTIIMPTKTGVYCNDYSEGVLTRSVLVKGGRAVSQREFTQKDGVRTIKKYLPFGENWLEMETTIEQGKIIREHLESDGPYKRALRDVTERMPDGTYKRTTKELFRLTDEEIANKLASCA